MLLVAAVGVFAEEPEELFARGYAAYQSRQYAEAAAWWLKAAELGHARAQNGLGVLHEEGLDVLRDHGRAVAWYRASAENGYALAMRNLGMMYRDGKGVAHDDIEAHKWLNLASSIHFDTDAALAREMLARRMRPEQIDEARRRAQAWFDAFFFGDEWE